MAAGSWQGVAAVAAARQGAGLQRHLPQAGQQLAAGCARNGRWQLRVQGGTLPTRPHTTLALGATLICCCAAIQGEAIIQCPS